MKILIIALGTRGDVQPYIALGLGLERNGHKVTICTTTNFRSFVTEYGLAFEPTRDEIVELMNTNAGRAVFDGGKSLWQTIKVYAELFKKSATFQMQMLEDTWAAAEKGKPDVIVYHPKGYGAPHFAQKLGIPVILALLAPMLVPTAAFPAFGFPTWKLGGWYNRFTSKLLMGLAAMGFGKYVKRWRKEHGMPNLQRVSLVNTPAGPPIAVMHGISRHVVPFPSDWPAYASMTGYWFLDEPQDWQPPQSLVDFINAGETPIYIGFGSMAGSKTAKVSQIVVDAVKKANVRAILSTGWGGINAQNLPDSILQIDGAPHSWLFPRMAAVVHHGGAGTTAAGLRAGKPSLICPFFGDQPAWGRQVHALGAGPSPIAQKDLTVDKLAAALQDLVKNADYRRNAEALGEHLRREDSIAPALAFIEYQMALFAK